MTVTESISIRRNAGGMHMSRHVHARRHPFHPWHTPRYVFAATPALLLSLCHPSVLYATCTGTAPATGTSVTCSGSGVVPVLAQAGSSNVTITINSDVNF